MKFHELSVKSTRKTNRVGRGISAGQGKTAGRGTKGQKARTGKKLRPGFAGGQNPLMQKLPKLPGFKSHRAEVQTVYTGQLENLKATTVDTAVLAEAGLITNAYGYVKLIKRGDVTKKLTVKLTGASASAVEAVQAAGGSFEVVARAKRAQTSTKKSAKAD